MSVVAAAAGVTPDDLLAMPDRKNYELVDGELGERVVSVLTSIVEMRLGGRLVAQVEAGNLGWVLSSGNGYQCFPDSPNTVRRPDLSFIRSERPRPEEIGDGWAKIHPDLAIEVTSPNDLSFEVEQKIEGSRSRG